MASPTPIYGPRWELALTDSMAADVRLAAAAAGVSRAEWIRQAIDVALADEGSTS